MTTARPVLFIQGAGAGTHDEWDVRLVDSLRRELGSEWEVHYPHMPDEDDARYATWGPAIRWELAGLGDGAVVVGHSVGGTLLVHTIAQHPPDRPLGGIVLLAAPFVGEGGWPGDGLEATSDLGSRLPAGVAVHVFHGVEDETVPPSHADLYAAAIPQARVYGLPGRDHQIDDDLREVASVITAEPTRQALNGHRSSVARPAGGSRRRR